MKYGVCCWPTVAECGCDVRLVQFSARLFPERIALEIGGRRTDRRRLFELPYLNGVIVRPREARKNPACI
eukprot:scaffold360848_cov20-Prasinocladus_malaysianus.AAC.1